MVQSYIGIVSRHGLVGLYREDEHLVRFLQRRVHRGRSLVGLVWAALDDQAVEYVHEQLAAGETNLALRSVQAYALHCGSILP